MKLGYTPEEATAMFDRLRPEAAEFFGDPLLLTIPFRVEFMGVEDETGSAYTRMWNPTNTGEMIVFNAFQLPYLYEDELRAILMHELAHAAGTVTEDGNDEFYRAYNGGHGPKWAEASIAYGSTPGLAVIPRRVSEIPFTNPIFRGPGAFPPPTFGPIPD